jgi:hypothetical protein
MSEIDAFRAEQGQKTRTLQQGLGGWSSMDKVR